MRLLDADDADLGRTLGAVSAVFGRRVDFGRKDPARRSVRAYRINGGVTSEEPLESV